uniref:Uncharacterized protein n=1 Tax=Tetraselmis sp. GSL018 TaxID=582737 RepID=A0A061R5F3_9CHLO|eukprot:CAMPEP_0177597470 /NCGR_PEP_ID=MMETSP0419_2-20121207/11725_1 /TAXON_ID=582737 /ORGANISM="Tetraselmis sp., Strain GSL018" /LENGTH=215 /DNA_ID=CAMNT_0019089635 /DNA_START=73 /DNA_END=720 /DNA_ORIENTATION=+
MATAHFLETDDLAPAFPLSKDELVERAKEFINSGFGSKKPELLSDDFQFLFPVVELDKDNFVKSFGSFRVDEAFPDLVTQYYGFRLDPVQPGRLWFDQISSGSHTGNFGGPFKHIKPTGKKVNTPPQAQSITFNEQGQVTQFTGGYVVDRRMGNTGGLGGLFGIMHAIGHTLPFPEAQPFRLSYRYRFFTYVNKTVQYIYGVVNGLLGYEKAKGS